MKAAIAEAAGERDVKALLDSVGGSLIARLFETLAAGGRVIAYGVQDPGGGDQRKTDLHEPGGRRGKVILVS